MNKAQLPRNWRNNNPLNIRRTKECWQGMTAEQSDRAFCQFRRMEYGWRAAFILLCRKYYHTYHLTTLQRIIERWAPATENNTMQYVEWVAAMADVDAKEQLPLPTNDNEDTWLRIAVAMALYEGGQLDTAQLMAVNLWKVMSGWDMYRIEEENGKTNE